MEKQKLVTVVVPIYNVEQYLKRCIDSIVNQTYKNLEIILVDDGSPDNCGKICDEYEKKDSRIKVIHKENGGLSDARNKGIDEATGDFITFVDSDDYISLDFIEYLLKLAVNNNCEISCCSFESFFEEPLKREIVEKINIYNKNDSLEKLYYQDNLTTSAWGKLYKLELFKGVSYPKGKICEDLDTTYKLFAKSKNIIVSNEEKYYYLQRTNSIINSKFSLKRMDAIAFAQNILQYTENQTPEIINAAKNRLFMEAIFIWIQIPKHMYYEEKKQLLDIIKKNRKIVLKDKKSKIGYRIIAFLTYLGMWSVKLLFNIKNKMWRIK